MKTAGQIECLSFPEKSSRSCWWVAVSFSPCRHAAATLILKNRIGAYSKPSKCHNSYKRRAHSSAGICFEMFNVQSS